MVSTGSYDAVYSSGVTDMIPGHPVKTIEYKDEPKTLTQSRGTPQATLNLVLGGQV